jgi:hypothetical protein
VKETIKLLINSVGSLVGQNILDVLEHPEFSRRHLFELIGTNSQPDSYNNFRCDRCYLVPQTSSPEFGKRIIQVIETELPDIILSGRDEDSLRIMSIRNDHSWWHGVLPYGTTQSLRIGLNKLETSLFAKRNRLAFAESFVAGKQTNEHDLKHFTDRVGFPFIAKPIEGYASKGVCFIRTMDEAVKMSNGDMIFQEYLGDPEALSVYFDQMKGPLPLYFDIPPVVIYSAASIINPDGEMAPICILENYHQHGITVRCSRIYDDVLESIASDFFKAYHAEGGVGPVSVQFRKDKNGNWKAMEMNLRSNGNTFSRFLFGQDEVGLIMKWFLGIKDFPVYTLEERAASWKIMKPYQTRIILNADIQTLEQSGIWSK